MALFVVVGELVVVVVVGAVCVRSSRLVVV